MVRTTSYSLARPFTSLTPAPPSFPPRRVQMGFGEVMICIIGGSLLVGRKEMLYFARCGGSVLGWSARKLLSGRAMLRDASSEQQLSSFRRELEQGLGEIQQIQSEMRAAGRLSTLIEPLPPSSPPTHAAAAPAVPPTATATAFAAPSLPVQRARVDREPPPRAHTDAQLAADVYHEGKRRRSPGGSSSAATPAGQPRSGSDWMAELLHERERVCVLAEAMPELTKEPK